MTEEEMAEMAADVCPRCESNLMVPERAQNALSRKDNETYVCSPCGEDEALRDFVGIPDHYWPTKAVFTFENLVTNTK